MQGLTVSRSRLASLFFFTAMPMGMWNVPLASVYTAHGRGHLVPWVLATTAIAAFVSPLFSGALMDQRMAGTRLLRLLTILTSIALGLSCLCLHWSVGDALLLVVAQLQALVSAPIWNIASSLVFSRLSNPVVQFGPLRACATFGWMMGCWLVSWVLGADGSVVAGAAAALLWLWVAIITRLIPDEAPAETSERRCWHQVLGLDALGLLRHRDHRVVFVTAALYCVPLAAFYPYTALHLRELGISQVAAVMSLAQVTEIATMLLLARVMSRVRLKWVFAAGIAICVLRYLMNAIGGLWWLLLGTFLHGFAFTLYFITTQIYLEQRIESRWRARAQALLALLMAGVGNLVGYLGGGWWANRCGLAIGSMDWCRFWSGQAAVAAVVLLFFMLAYRGRGPTQTATQ